MLVCETLYILGCAQTICHCLVWRTHFEASLSRFSHSHHHPHPLPQSPPLPLTAVCCRLRSLSQPLPVAAAPVAAAPVAAAPCRRRSLSLPLPVATAPCHGRTLLLPLPVVGAPCRLRSGSTTTFAQRYGLPRHAANTLW